MAKKVRVVLTPAQARELLNVAGNGYGDGEYYEKGMGTHPGQHDAYIRAVEAVRSAVYEAENRRGKSSPAEQGEGR